MDIYGAQKNIEKLLDYVKGLADTRPTMYAKSKDRLKELACTCNEVVEVISEILQDEVLEDDNVEFATSTAEMTDVSAMLTSMQSQLDKLRTLVGVSQQTTSSNQIRPPSPENKKAVMRAYRDCLSKLSNVETGIEYADECAKLLWTWFDLRFYKTAHGSNFKYNIKRISGWIRDIVILYGSAIHRGERGKFMEEFHEWLNLISTTDARDKFAVPYFVYQFNKSPDGSQLTLEATILWDILLNNGLKSICRKYDELYPTTDCIYDMCDDMNPEVLDNYKDYSKYPDIFDILKWSVKGGE